MNLKKLNVGCGYDIRPKPWVNIDQFDKEGVDIVMDLDTGKLPIENESVDEIYAAHILEHVHHWERLMPEFARVLVPGGSLTIKVPYHDLGAFHIRQFNEWTLYLFYNPNPQACIDGQHNGYEVQAMFDLDDFQVRRRRLYNYHFKKYLHIDVGIPARKNELTWVLKRPGCSI